MVTCCHIIVSLESIVFFRITQGSRTNNAGADCVSRGVKKRRPDYVNRYDEVLNKT
jgi:hypothetical protein